MGCYDIFCTLCGGPLNTGIIWDSLRSPDPEPGGAYWDYNQNLLCDEDLEWLRDVRIIAEWQNSADRDKHLDVTAEVYYASEFDACMGTFDATNIHGVTHWCYAFAKYENEDNYSGNHFVMHSACLLIVKRWMFEEGKSIQDLYNALCVYNLNDFRGVYLPDLHYGAETLLGAVLGGSPAVGRMQFMVKDPVNIPDMTEYILSKLRDVPLKEDESSVQNSYRKQLLSGHLFALQDLDLSLIGKRWDEIKDKDWRRLVRTLTRYENFYAGEGGSGVLGELHDAPIGLKNRIRLIKIAQGIFVGT